MVETHFYRQGELVATLRYEDGESTFGGPDPETARRISEQLYVVTESGTLGFGDDPELWLRAAPGELRSPYISAQVTADDGATATS